MNMSEEASALSNPAQGRHGIVFVGLPDDASCLVALQQPQYLGCRYLVSILRANGCEAHLVNVVLDPSSLSDVFFQTDRATTRKAIDRLIVRRALEVLESHDLTRLVVGFTTSWKHVDLVLQVATAVKHRHPRACVVLGGVYVTLCPQATLSSCPQVDYALCGEAENSIVPFMRSMEQGLPEPQKIPGLAYRAINNQVVVNPLGEVVRDLDSLPLPAEDDIEEVYRRNDHRLRIVSSRGCYGQCTFCSIHAFSQAILCRVPRARSAVNVADEIEHLHARYGFDRFVFADANAIGAGVRGRERAVALAEEIERRGLRSHFKLDARANDFELDMGRRLRRAGLYGVEFGLEALDDDILRRFRKHLTLQQILHVANLLTQEGLWINLSFMFYTPWTTRKGIESSLGVVKGLLANPRIVISPLFRSLKLIPGTEVARELAEESIALPNHMGHVHGGMEKEAERLMLRHLEFSDQAETLLGNLPPLWSNLPPAWKPLAVSYRQAPAEMRGLTIAYLEGLLADDSDRLKDCHARLIQKRDALRRIHEWCGGGPHTAETETPQPGRGLPRVGGPSDRRPTVPIERLHHEIG